MQIVCIDCGLFDYISGDITAQVFADIESHWRVTSGKERNVSLVEDYVVQTCLIWSAKCVCDCVCNCVFVACDWCFPVCCEVLQCCVVNRRPVMDYQMASVTQNLDQLVMQNPPLLLPRSYRRHAKTAVPTSIQTLSLTICQKKTPRCMLFSSSFVLISHVIWHAVLSK